MLCVRMVCLLTCLLMYHTQYIKYYMVIDTVCVRSNCKPRYEVLEEEIISIRLTLVENVVNFQNIALLFFLVFGMALCIQFNPNEDPAPIVVIKCTEEIERCAVISPKIDLYKLYKSNVSKAEVEKLRNAINEGKDKNGNCNFDS